MNGRAVKKGTDDQVRRIKNQGFQWQGSPALYAKISNRIAEPGAEIWFNVTAPQSVGLPKPVTNILAELPAIRVR